MIPGWLITLATFPGVIIHEVAHMFFCKRFRIAVLDVCFFRLGNPAGYVLHEPVTNFQASFLISVGPFLINSILCIFFCFVSFIPVMELEIPDIPSYILYWLGISIGMHSFPSGQDAKILWINAKKSLSTKNPLTIITFPLCIFIYIANILSVFWFDLIYAMGIGVGLPIMILKLLV